MNEICTRLNLVVLKLFMYSFKNILLNIIIDAFLLFFVIRLISLVHVYMHI